MRPRPCGGSGSGRAPAHERPDRRHEHVPSSTSARTLWGSATSATAVSSCLLAPSRSARGPSFSGCARPARAQPALDHRLGGQLARVSRRAEEDDPPGHPLLRRPALLDRRPHLLDRLGDAALDALQVPAGERDDPDGSLGSDRGVPERLLEQPHLAEEVARPEVRHVLTVPGDLRLALLDRHELVGEVALAHQLASLLNRDLLREGRDFREFVVGYVREQRNRLQATGIQRVLLGRSVAATLPN